MKSNGKSGPVSVRKRAVLMAAAVAIANVPQVIHATTKSWTGTSGNWSTGTNWSSGSKPTTGDFAVLAKSGGLTCTYDLATSPFTVGSIQIDNGMTLAQGSVANTQLNPGSMIIGSSSFGNYSLSSGTLGVTNQIILGAGSAAGGSINLSGGSLSATTINIGSLGGGSFIMTNGTASVTNMSVGTSSGAGFLRLDGGVLHASGTVTVGTNGSFTSNGGGQTSATTTVVLAGGAASGTINSNGTFISNSGTLSGTGAGTFLTNNGTFIYNGGDNSKWHFDNSGTFILNTNWTAQSLTNESGNTINLPSAFTVNLNTTVSSDRALSNDGTMSLNGGVLNATNSAVFEIVGDGDTGYFNHVSGTANLSNLVLGNGSAAVGTYNLQAGTLSVNTSEQIGVDGVGTLVQGNATHTITGDLELGVDSIGFGAMNINGGTLTVLGAANALFAGVDGTGTITQTAGLVNTPGITLGFDAGSSGTYKFGGGTISTTSLLVSEDQNTCLFQQTGGAATATNLVLGDFTIDSHGSYLLSSGTLNTSQETIGNVGIGSFAQLGGSHTVSSLMVLSNGTDSFGTFALGGGTLTVPLITLNANGQFIQTGGVLNVGSINFETFNSRYSFQAGLLHLTSGSLAVSDSGLLGSDISTASNRSIIVDNSVDLTALGQIDINGGTFSAGTLINDGGQISLNAGTLQIKNSTIEIGNNQPLGASVQLNSGANLLTGTSNSFLIDGNAVLVLNGGQVTATSGLTNNGQIDLQSPTSIINGGTLTNSGLINGNGHINNILSNSSTGEVRADSDDDLQFKGAGNVNAGRFTLNGGRIEFSNDLTNGPTGTINGRGSLVATGGLTNNGAMNFSAGFSDVYGNVTNNKQIIVTGGSTTTFYNAVTNNSGGSTRIDVNSNAVFLGNVSVSGVTGSGTAYYDGTAVGGPLVNAGASIVDPGGTLDADYIRQNALTVNGAATLNSNGTSANFSRVTSLTISNGIFDLANNDLIVDGGSLGAIRGEIQSAYANGAWTGQGLTSSAAAANSGPKTGLGYAMASAINAASFDGQSVNPSSVLIGYTDLGDANLDGTVNALDFNALATNYGQQSGSEVWTQGDFNYNGTVDSADFADLAANYGQTMSQSASPAALGAVVPEPCGAIVVGLSGLLMARRRFK